MTGIGEVGLVFETFPQAMWNLVRDGEIADRKMGIGSIRHYNFYRDVRLQKAEITTNEGKNPKRLQVYMFGADGNWERVRDLDLPYLEIGDKHEIDLNGIECRFMRIECAEHYPIPFPAMGDQWHRSHNPPYGVLDGLSFIGEYVGDPYAPEMDQLPVGDVMRRGSISPVAPSGMTVKTGGFQVRYFSETFSVGFSLNRPVITHMGWDSIGGGKSRINLIRNAISLRYGQYPALNPNMSGPHWRALPWTAYSSVWGGEIAVEGNVVRYTNLSVGGEVSVDATFTVSHDGMRLELTQRTATQRPTLELEAWRFVWDGQASAVASLAMPICRGRTGAATLPLVWSAPGHGALSCRLVESSGPVRVQADSHRANHITFAGLILGSDDPYPTTHIIPGAGTVAATFEFRPEPLLPVLSSGVADADLHPAIRREWGSGLMFRPELAGFSNNALSTNCHQSQSGVVDLACLTRKPDSGPDPVLLARHTITMALKEGRGYGDNRDVYLDSDPVLIIGAGRVFMTRPDRSWLAETWPWLRRIGLSHLSRCDSSGLVVTPITTGDRSRQLSDRGPHGENVFLPCNAYDTINMGHIDGYSNAETYRAWKSLLGLAIAAKDADMQARMRDALTDLRENYEMALWNEQTGWLGSWRSRDGELHDYGMTAQNAGACLYGLVSEQRARGIMARMEEARTALGLRDSAYGFPCYLKAIPMCDQMPFCFGTAYRYDGQDAFGIYCNGTVTLTNAHLYLSALSAFGPAGAAQAACSDILDAHLDLDVVGGEGSGCEFHTFEGLRTGGEGAFVLQFPVLLAIAQHMGWTPYSEPRYWPAEAEE